MVACFYACVSTCTFKQHLCSPLQLRYIHVLSNMHPCCNLHDVHMCKLYVPSQGLGFGVVIYVHVSVTSQYMYARVFGSSYLRLSVWKSVLRCLLYPLSLCVLYHTRSSLLVCMLDVHSVHRSLILPTFDLSTNLSSADTKSDSPKRWYQIAWSEVTPYTRRGFSPPRYARRWHQAIVARTNSLTGQNRKVLRRQTRDICNTQLQ
jgi:hypothetical protein